MDHPPRDCPSAATLGRLGADSLDADRFATLEDHVAACPACQAELERRAHAQTLGGAAVGPDAPPEIPDFVIEGVLGRGGMGVVYRAWQPVLMRHVALKLLPGGPTAGSRERWLREARSLGRVHDPGVVRLFDVGEAGGWRYLVLELVPGGSLEDRLRGPLAPRDAAALTARIAGAVAAIHRAGLLHLDLKPSNILLDGPADAPWSEVVPRVSDFGIARLLPEAGASLSAPTGTWGTPSYMAPEQVVPDAARIGPATDVYALGAILYELLTDRPPFRALSAIETLDQVRALDPVAPRALDPGIPRDLETICTKCLSKDPGRRYARAETLADDLSRWLDGRPIAARPASAAGLACRWCLRRPATAIPLAALAVTLVAGLAVLSALLGRAEAERGRAEANYRIASTSLDELLKLALESGDEADPAAAFTPSHVAVLEATRDGLVALRRSYPGAGAELRRLARIDRLLAHAYEGRKKFAEARGLLEEAVGLWEESLAREPGDDRAREEQVAATFGLLGDAYDVVADRARFEWWDARLASMLDRARSHPNYLAMFTSTEKTHRRFADELARRGDADRARSLFEADLRRFDELDEARAGQPTVVLSRLTTLAALGRPAADPAPAGGEPARLPNSSGPGDLWCVYMAELAARRNGWAALGLPTEAAPSDDAWADRLLASIRSLCEATGLDMREMPKVGFALMDLAARTASDHRRAGRLDEASRDARRLHALAGRLVRDYPDRPEGLLLESEAHNQDAKNAWRLDDDASAVRSLRLALESSRRAVALNPGHPVALSQFEDRRRRLAAHEP